ncbi:SUMF1/EgtB/PvdO family nonheme iron enzyme [Bradyrhizobium sp. CSA207]|uniref:nSTAND1 domain-containing NTPase n=1 Tax=Bradyrhizobium sp. CSA207 TaxID=2698826 RepID=UPI0023AFF46F|nr:SUMF1/EgtB/PvdO family nonheme iron enzyme [Bradyrhizobium sp. CSA207]MDE5446374.1 SUMF1/EgtB/PvdO family nonheme iron enzyme [Bradyrhizobium sp. CSA207]
MTDTLRIFISSPSDVRPERLKAEQIVKRLDKELAPYRRVNAVLWERQPLVASRAFQDPENIPQPRLMDVVVVILWSRLGIPLPADKYRGAISNRVVTGTEWEFEDALLGARSSSRGVPKLLLYHKTAEPSSGLGNRAEVEARLAQLDAVQLFLNRWLRSDDTSFDAAFHTFVDTTEFEDKLYEHLHKILQQSPSGSSTVRWRKPPFRGLLSFDFEHAPVFFGRTRARNQLRDLLARRIEEGCSFVLVLGASGVGKSSLVKAGLIPDLTLPGMIGRVGLVRWLVFRPSDGTALSSSSSLEANLASGSVNTPVESTNQRRAPLFDALADAIIAPTALPEISAFHWTSRDLGSLLREAPKQAVVAIQQGLAMAATAAGLVKGSEARLLLMIDQLEELFTGEEIAQSDRNAFVAALDSLARCGLVWIVATMRSDFFHRLESVQPLVSLSSGARFLLTPPDEAELAQIVRQPAIEGGLQYEVDNTGGVSLDAVICKAASEQIGSLPLLSFLLDQLWHRRSRTGLLTFEAYENLGGLEGAVGLSAEQVFLSLPPDVQAEFVAVLRALVTVEGATVTSRPAPLSKFPAGSARRKLIDALLHPNARLLIAEDSQAHERLSASVDDQARIRLGHEALLTHWERARVQVANDARDLELRDRLEREVTRWQAAEARSGRRQLTATGLLLAEARDLVARWGAELPSQVVEFVAASKRAADLSRLRVVSALFGALLALPVALLMFYVAWVAFGVRAVESRWEAEGEFVQIPPNSVSGLECFQMGSPETEPGRFENEGPVHPVCLKRFDLGKYDITQEEWSHVMSLWWGNTRSYFQGARRPVDSADWNDARWFVTFMSIFGNYEYRLPTEAEWEYAARAGTKTPYFWGDSVNDGCPYAEVSDAPLSSVVAGALTVDCQHAKLAAPSSVDSDGLFQRIRGTSDVGSFKPNPWGLYDMSGNVFQWTSDCYVASYKSAKADGSSVLEKGCESHVVRGSSFDFNPGRVLRVAYRSDGAPASRFDYVGFRVVRAEPRGLWERLSVLFEGN